MPSTIRTVLIDDSAFMRKVISDILLADDAIELAGVANNGQQGLQMVEDLKPHVIVTDMVMPDYNGLYVVTSVMEKNPLPIILLSSLEKTDSRIFDALELGAFEFIDKPNQVNRENLHEYGLINLIKQAAQTDIALLKAQRLSKKNNNTHNFEQALYQIVVIGASTGGPGAVEYVLGNLPGNLQIPVVVAQHMPHRFIETFTERLKGQIHLPIKIARKGETLKGGMIYVAPGESNLRIEKNVITGKPMFTFTEKKYAEFNYPSIDCLFESVAETYMNAGIGIILTGMGKDGTLGLQKIKEKGGYTIAQDEGSSVVYGMPKAAYESGAVLQVVNLKQIPGFIVSCL